MNCIPRDENAALIQIILIIIYSNFVLDCDCMVNNPRSIRNIPSNRHVLRHQRPIIFILDELRSKNKLLDADDVEQNEYVLPKLHALTSFVKCTELTEVKLLIA